MVVRAMLLRPISQCNTSLDFLPRAVWPSVFPALAWRGHLVCGFERSQGEALELGESNLVEILKSCHPELGLAEFARLQSRLEKALPDLFREFREPLCSAYQMRWSDRLQQTFAI